MPTLVRFRPDSRMERLMRVDAVWWRIKHDGPTILGVTDGNKTIHIRRTQVIEWKFQ